MPIQIVTIGIDSEKPLDRVLAGVKRLLAEKGAKLIDPLCTVALHEPPEVPDDYCMPFGQHQGELMDNVPAEYLDWCRDQPWIHTWPLVQAYIHHNESRIDEELE